MTSTVDEHRKLVPFTSFISSAGTNGSLMVINVFIQPDKFDEYIKIVTPVILNTRAMPETLWCEVSQNPTDAGHIRIITGCKKGTEWFAENCETQSWFSDYVKQLVHVADKTRRRDVAHFDLIPIN